MKSIDKYITKKFKDIIVSKKSFKDITTIKIGGEIKYLLYPKTIKQMIAILRLCKKHNERYVVLGAGSNVLASDNFFDGIVICTKKLTRIKTQKNSAFAECGALIGSVVLKSRESCLSNLEWAIGIPGTIGGAAVMNAGAFGGEFYDNVLWVKIFDGKRIKKILKKDISFSYRTTMFQNSQQIILGVKISMLQKSYNEISKKIEFFVQKRQNLQNIGYPNAGSVFKKLESCSASELIDRLNLKGKRFGDAMVSTVHSGFIVNLKSATFEDVKKLIAFICESVYNIYCEKLELEIVVIGEDR